MQLPKLEGAVAAVAFRFLFLVERVTAVGHSDAALQVSHHEPQRSQF